LVIDPSAQVQRPLHPGLLGFGRVESELVSLKHIDLYVIIEIYRLLHKGRAPLSSCYDYVVTPVNSAS
jgi:hypothetical protein